MSEPTQAPQGDTAGQAAAPTPDAVHAGLRQVGEAVDIAIEAVNAGSLIDLAGLEERVASLCEDIKTLSAADGRTLEATLLDLVGRLDRLSETLARRRDDLLQRPAATAPQDATAAYRKPQP